MKETTQYDTADLLQFTKGYIDATESDEAYCYVTITPKPPFVIIGNSGFYSEHLPYKWDEANNVEELIEEFESKGWTNEGSINNPAY